MPRIVQMSDLHLTEDLTNRLGLLEQMSAALAQVNADARQSADNIDILAITGDLFESSDLNPEKAVQAFFTFYDYVVRGLGRIVPTFIVVGNHDVRSRGILSLNRTQVIDALRAATKEMPHIVIHACNMQLPFILHHVPRDHHPLPAELVLVDSTYLPTGFASAGGLVRQEDLLQVASELEPELPLVLLTHHHLVPTPVTDMSEIDTSSPHIAGESWLQRKISAAESKVEAALLKAASLLVANADFEELTMTALGAGSTLSTLHALNRAVLVLHGHKHHPSARHMKGLSSEDGDILLVADGSTGKAEPWHVTKQHVTDPPWPLWPSFNVIQFDAKNIRVETWAYPHDQRAEMTSIRRLLVTGERSKNRWFVQTDSLSEASLRADRDAEIHESRVLRNEAHVELRDADQKVPFWTAHVLRRLVIQATSEGSRILHKDYVDGAPGAFLIRSDSQEKIPCPAQIEFEVTSNVSEYAYTLYHGLCGTYEQAIRSYDKRTAPYDWIDLFNRFACAEATLVLQRYPEGLTKPFAALIDLTTGIERPLPLDRVGNRYELHVRNCQARTLLRIFWPLTSEKS